MIHGENDNYCNTCPTSIRGMCCWFSYFDGEENFIIFPCNYLNKKTRRCTIYKDRFKINPHCLDIDTAYMMGALPKECAYVKLYDFEPSLPFKTVNLKKLKEMIKNGIQKGRFPKKDDIRRALVSSTQT